MKRGEIYFIFKRDAVGNEIAKARPGIIVSNNVINSTSGVVEVVYLTTQPKKDLPTHVAINSSGVPSVACCEQIDSVSVQLVGNFRGVCTAEEMKAIDTALLASLGIDNTREDHGKWVDDLVGEMNREQRLQLRDDNAALRAECDRYKKIIDTLLGVIEI